MAKNIAILGSTGSIGTNSLKVIDALGEGYRVCALTAHNNVELLAEQVRKYVPDVVVLTNPEKLAEFKKLCPKKTPEIFVGSEAMANVAGSGQVDVVIAAVVGSAGLPAILAAAKAGKTLAIANKEPLVVAGELLTKTAEQNGATILPVDSEHSAVFQSLHSGQNEEISRIILTASGGPFRGASREQIQNATLQEALEHPTWNMGKKITIDSATMINKALEVIEAKWLFGVPAEKIEILVHPESIVHSMVEFIDGSVIAQLSPPDMCLPIQYALTYPKRMAGITKHLELEKIGTLSFEKPDMQVFKALKLGYDVVKTGGTAPAVFNAANEAAVEEFLAGNIKFADITELIEKCLDKHNVKQAATLDELFAADKWARNEVAECLKKVKL